LAIWGWSGKGWFSSTLPDLKYKEECYLLWTGTEKTVFRYLVHCDVFLHPSLRESGGFAIVEALSAGRPVICLDLGGPGLQVNKQNGFSFPAISPLQVKTKIVEALDFLVQNEKVRQEMYYSAVKGIKADYLWSAKVKHIYRLYQVAVDNTVVEKE